MAGGDGLPRVTELRVRDTHRLIAAKYLDQEASVLDGIAEDLDHLAALFELDHATNERLVAENGLLPGIGPNELVAGFRHYRVVNAAFTHAAPQGSRFNGPDRGAWYAGFNLKTAQAEILHHKSLEFLEIGWDEPETAEYEDYLADFTGAFHDLRGDEDFADCLALDSYLASQTLAARLLALGSSGVVYPSVRTRGSCIACFRPAMVDGLRRGGRYQYLWPGLKGKPRMAKVDPR